MFQWVRNKQQWHLESAQHFGSASCKRRSVSSKSPHTVRGSTPLFSKAFVRYSAGVFRDTPHESGRKTNQPLPTHCNHPSTTRAVHQVARTDVCTVPRSLLFWRGVSGLQFPFTWPQLTRTTFFPHSRPPLRRRLCETLNRLHHRFVASLEHFHFTEHGMSLSGWRSWVDLPSSLFSLFDREFSL